ncbi:MAG: hypothetical protein HYX29_11540 [Solirubrobacterales bacterium]|nr:hypothetical protein [Solirubrobacterales bacterium]
MTQRYVAPVQIVSVEPEYPRYSVQEDRRKPVVVSSKTRRPDPPPYAGSSRRDFRAFGLLILLAALAIVVAISLLV